MNVVESEGGADFSFTYLSDGELRENEVVKDIQGRSYVLISVSPDLAP